MTSLDESRAAFPLIRHVSHFVTRLLLATPLTANHVTALSLIFGLAAALEIASGGRQGETIGAVLFFVSYVLDNCDGEIARLKKQRSKFGHRFDTFVDWAVHAAFFFSLGLGIGLRTGERLWLWLEVAAAAGATINYVVSLVREHLAPTSAGGRDDAPLAPRRPESPGEWLVFAFRELARADFCFLVLIFALLDMSWILLMTGAVGAQVYWIVQFARGARDYHV